MDDAGKLDSVCPYITSSNTDRIILTQRIVYGFIQMMKPLILMLLLKTKMVLIFKISNQNSLKSNSSN